MFEPGRWTQDRTRVESGQSLGSSAERRLQDSAVNVGEGG